MNKQVRATYMTTSFRVSYPSLFEPVAQMGDEKVKKYCLTMLFPSMQKAAEMKAATHPAARYVADDNCRGFYQEICKVARANFGPEIDLTTIKLPKFRDGNKPKQSGKIDDNEKGYIIVRTTSKDRPDVTRGDKTRVTDAGELYPGCWARAVLTIAPFVTPLARGVTVYLAGVQKIADDETFSSRPRVEDIFDEVAVDQPSVVNEAPTVTPTGSKDPWEL